MAGLPEQSDDADLNRLIAKRWLAIAQTYLDQEKETEAAASFQRALAHGAPSVALAARQALDRLGAGQSAQAGGSLSASR